MSERVASYREFWPYYLREHAKPGTRYVHYFGTSLVLLCLFGFAITGGWGLLIVAPIAGYGPAWIGHFVVEKNRPATFRYPLWSLASDFRMFFTWLAGGMQRELAKAGIGT